MKRALLMSRVSSDEQAKGYSLDVQEQRLREYCKRSNIEVVESFREDHSAKSFDRPEYKKLEALAKKTKGRIDLLLVTTWDRFSRNALEALQKVHLFASWGIEVQAIDQPSDTSIPENKLMQAFYLTFPQVENERRSIKITEGVKAAKLEGRWLSIAPFGYNNERDELNKPIIIPNEHALVVATIFSNIYNGMSQAEVRSRLKQQGIHIGKSRFSEMLRSRVYVGEIFVKCSDNPPGYYVKGLHSPIVDQEVFYGVQRLLDGKSVKKKPSAKYNATQEQLFLRGHLACPTCGAHVTGSASRGRNGRHFYYHCNHCGEYRLKVDEAHHLVEEILKEFSFSKPAQKLYDLMVKQQLSSTFKQRKKSKDTLEKEITDLAKKLENLDDKFADNEIDKETYARLYGRYNPQLQLLKRELEEHSNENTEYTKYLKSGINLLSDLKGFYLKADIYGRKKLLGSIFPEKLQLSKNKSRTAKINEAVRLILATGKDSTKNKAGQLFQNLELSGKVEATGIEPVSKHDIQKLSTCLFRN